MVIDPPSKNCKKHIIRWTQDGRRVSMVGEKSQRDSMRLAGRIEGLIEAKSRGDLPPQDLLEWARKLTPTRIEKLRSLGLIDGVVSECTDTSLMVMTDEYQVAVASRRNNTHAHAAASANKVKKISDILGLVDYRDLRPEKVLACLRENYESPTTRRSYLIHIRDFCKWAVKSGKASNNLFDDIELPPSIPGWDRRPFTVDEIRTLFSFLKDHDRYPDQRTAKWIGYDRYLIYWTAIKTGYRLSEMRSLRRRHLFKHGGTWFIGLEGRKTKNRKKAAIPIPDDLAKALNEYLSGVEAGDAIFWIPIGHGAATMIRRDIKSAGLGKLLKSGQQIDFHCLRATAITWWLHEDRRSPKEVQFMARFHSLSMVDRYTRGFSNDTVEWVKNSTPVL